MLGLEQGRRAAPRRWPIDQPRRPETEGRSMTARVAGLAALGMAAYLFYLFLPEAVRTYKIHRM